MAAFEFSNNPSNRQAHRPDPPTAEILPPPDPRRLRQESIIAFKIYDSCRHRNCLTHRDIGPARAAHKAVLDDGKCIDAGDVVIPPSHAVSVTAEGLRVSSIQIISKEPNPFKQGFWTIKLRYTFEYDLVFKRADGHVISVVAARSTFEKRCVLFGSNGNDVTISTDLFVGPTGEPFTMDSDPYIMVEAKAVALSADIKRPQCKHTDEQVAPAHVNVTIGLFGIVKLYRIVSLLVDSRGFSIAPPCENIIPPNPCEFFETIDFPIDVFSPPQRLELAPAINDPILQTPDEMPEE
jgi:hypothetical protein